MADSMMFPNRWEKFMKDYSFVDHKEFYTNGARLIQTFRVEQMIEHYFAADNNVGRWIPVSERLPEDDLPKDSKRKSIKVLVTYKTSNGVPVVRTQVREKEPWFGSKGWDWTKFEPITHWMPLPEPPQEEE